MDILPQNLDLDNFVYFLSCVKFDIFIDPEAKSDTGDKKAIEHLIKNCLFLLTIDYFMSGDN